MNKLKRCTKRVKNGMKKANKNAFVVVGKKELKRIRNLTRKDHKQVEKEGITLCMKAKV
jgi:hypothetical protein